MKRVLAGFIVAILSCGAAHADAVGNLKLACPGNIDDTTTQSGFFGPTKRHEQIPDQVDIEISGDAGRARVPRKFFPMFARVQDGWAEIKNLSVRDDAIDGLVNLGSNAKPRLHIDRTSGTITVEGGLGRFFGSCKAIDPSTRAF